MATYKIGLVTFMVIGILSIMTASASANIVIAGQPTIVSSSSSSSVASVETAEVDISTEGKIILRWISTTPKKVHGCKKVKSFKKAGNAKCIILPVGTPFNNSGVNSEGKTFTFRDYVKKGDQKFYRKSTKTNKWCKSTCRNCAPQAKASPLKVKNVILVKSFAKVKFKVTLQINALATASANATCVGSGVSATASASAQGAANAYVDIYVYAWTKLEARASARVSVKQKLDVEASAKAQATANVSASATASCSGGTVYICPIGSTWNGERCAKDGTTTPPPPPEAPGPNPPPDPNEPFPGGYQCYKETTGEPVPPVNGLCPAGTVGNPI